MYGSSPTHFINKVIKEKYMCLIYAAQFTSKPFGS